MKQSQTSHKKIGSEHAWIVFARLIVFLSRKKLFLFFRRLPPLKFFRPRRIILFVVLAFVLYSVLSIVLPSVPHQSISEEALAGIDPEEYYAQEEGSERILCMDDNTDALLWRLRVIESAQDDLILSSLDFRADNSGSDLIAALLAAADRGVHVRILLDGFCWQVHSSYSKEFKTLASHDNVELRVYNPVRVWKLWTTTFRLHGKFLIADENVYILGGRNTYDSFLGDYTDTQYIDRDLLVYETDPDAGNTSLTQLLDYFSALWDLSCNKTIRANPEKASVAAARADLAERYALLQEEYPSVFETMDFYAATSPTNKVTLLYNQQAPENREPVMWATMCQLMSNRSDVLIQTPYVMCSQDMYQGLTEVCAGTANVAIVTNAVETGSNPWGCTDYMNEKSRILQTGVTVYEFAGSSSSHAKAILIDDRLSLVGSCNMDMRSTYLDTELMLAVDSEELNAQLRGDIRQAISASRQVRPDGSVEYGSQYTPVQMSVGKQAAYQVLRVLIRPFRHML